MQRDGRGLAEQGVVGLTCVIGARTTVSYDDADIIASLSLARTPISSGSATMRCSGADVCCRENSGMEKGTKRKLIARTSMTGILLASVLL